MATGKNCPACQLDIGVWPIIKGSIVTLTGTRFRCPHCAAKLRHAGWGIDGVFMVMMIPVLIASMGLAYTFIPWNEPRRVVIFSCAGILLLSPLALLASALYVRKHKTLILAEGDAARQPPAA